MTAEHRRPEEARQRTAHRKRWGEHVDAADAPGRGERRLLSIVTRDRRPRLIRYMLDEAELLAPFGVRALSRVHRGRAKVPAVKPTLREEDQMKRFVSALLLATRPRADAGGSRGDRDRGRPPRAGGGARPARVPVKSRLHQALDVDGAIRLAWCFLLGRLDALAAVRGIDRVLAYAPRDARWTVQPLVPPAFTLVPQEGADLGERLSTLLAWLLAREHPWAIAVDSDSPTLPLAYVREAAAVLGEDRADVVLGPCEDGGYYLIGTRRPHPGLFEGIPWSTEQVPENARVLDLRVHLLPSWVDVDTERDLRRLHEEMIRQGGGPSRTFHCVAEIYREAAPKAGASAI